VKPYLSDPDFVLYCGDAREVLRKLPAASVDAIVTDPPYGISFMGKHWDRFDIDKRVGKRDVSKLGVRLTGSPDSGDRKLIARTGSAFANAASQAGGYDFSVKGNRAFQAWCEQWGTECLRILKPGGHALVFGGTRTYHRLASGLEDAGFEIRDCLCWLYGSGFPKSRNLGDGWGTALKPAFEPIVVARKPLIGTVAANVLEHGTGAINVDGCRIPHASPDDLATSHGKNPGRNDSVTSSVYGADRPQQSVNDAGRWPANLALDEETASMLDEQSGELAPGASPPKKGLGSARVYGDAERAGVIKEREPLDGGGASRFFYVAKTSRAERNAGLEGFDEQDLRWSNGDQNPGSFQADGTKRSAQNFHPTVKPIALMRWLVRLVTPPGGVIVDPFLGSGTTGIAAVLEGFRFTGVEREEDYLPIAEARIRFWRDHGDDGLRIVAERDKAARVRTEIAETGQLSLGETA